MMWRYKRLELPKRELQEQIYERYGVELQDPEMLLKLVGILDQFEEYDFYEDYKDDGDDDATIIIVEGWVYGRRTRRP